MNEVQNALSVLNGAQYITFPLHCEKTGCIKITGSEIQQYAKSM